VVANEVRLMLKPPKHVVFVLDYSGSMNCTGRIEGALINIDTIFKEHCGSQDRVSFITFTNKVKVRLRLCGALTPRCS
jgi:Mg-chelatase subunit ChlD